MRVKNKTLKKILLKDFTPGIIVPASKAADLAAHWTTKQIADSKQLDSELESGNLVGLDSADKTTELALKHSRNMASGWKGTQLREYEFPVLGGMVGGAASQKLAGSGVPGIAFGPSATGTLYVVNGTPNDHVLKTGGKIRLYCSFPTAVAGAAGGVRLSGACHFARGAQKLASPASTSQTVDLRTKGAAGRIFAVTFNIPANKFDSDANITTFKIERLGANAGDTYPGDLFVHHLTLEYRGYVR